MAAEQLKKVVLIGATGNLGGNLLAQLRENKKFEVTILSRYDSKAEFPKEQFPTEKIVKVDYASHSDMVSALKGQDAIVSAVGTFVVESQLPIVDAAAEAGVKRFIPSEYGINTHNKLATEICPDIVGHKTEIRERIQARSKEHPTFSYTSLSTGPFFDFGVETGFLGFNTKEKKASLWNDGNRIISATGTKSIARAVVGILEHPAETRNQNLYISSHQLSQNQLFSAIRTATKTREADWNTTHLKYDESVLKSPNRDGFHLILAATYFPGPSGSDFVAEEKGNLANDLLGLPKPIEASNPVFQQDVETALTGVKL